jgi:hypothetical protein
MRRRAFLVLAAALPVLARGDTVRDATLYKSPDCGCCHEHAAHLRRHGYRVKEIATPDLDALKRRQGVPEELFGCHTTLVGGYVVEGHVSAAIVDRLLREKPEIRGVSLPGMPTGSPGMGGAKREPFRIYEIARGGADAAPRLYAVE